MKINTLIIDDEISACETLESLLHLIKAPVNVLGKIHDVESAIESINKLKPDLIFLDIQLPTGSGFSILENIKNKNINVIFVTAHEEYAIKAFRYSAIDYLLKPIIINDLKESIAKISERFNKTDESIKINTLLQNNPEKKEKQKLVINSETNYQVIEINEIIRMQSSGNYTSFYLKNGNEIISSKPLKYYNTLITEDYFFRIHRSHFINVQFVISFTKGLKPTCYMSDGSILEISREKKDEFFKLLEAI